MPPILARYRRDRGCAVFCAALLLVPQILPCLAMAADPARIDVSGGLTRGASSEEEMRQQGLWSTQSGPSLEAPIDPAAYRLVPGDELHLGIWGEAPRGYSLAVSPVGELIVPKVGPVGVAGESLAEAELRIQGLLAPYYPGSPVTLRLLHPGRFLVPVTGLVGQPGVFEATRLDRLSSILGQAGGVHAGGSLRRIQVTRADHSQATVDLLPWLAEGRLESNPTLEPGTQIEVPNRGPVVRIRGPVNGRAGLGEAEAAGASVRPDAEPSWVLEWKEGDTVGSILEMAGGLSELASSGIILRSPAGPERRLDLADAGTAGVAMHPGDDLEVLYAPRWVFVVGAIRSPGRYPYLPGLEARDYVHMAGGPTELGRASGWSVEPDAGGKYNVGKVEIAPGTTIRVPERRSYKLTTILAPVTSATALIISVVALVRR